MHSTDQRHTHDGCTFSKCPREAQNTHLFSKRRGGRQRRLQRRRRRRQQEHSSTNRKTSLVIHSTRMDLNNDTETASGSIQAPPPPPNTAAGEEGVEDSALSEKRTTPIDDSNNRNDAARQSLKKEAAESRTATAAERELAARSSGADAIADAKTPHESVVTTATRTQGMDKRGHQSGALDPGRDVMLKEKERNVLKMAAGTANSTTIPKKNRGNDPASTPGAVAMVPEVGPAPVTPSGASLSLAPAVDSVDPNAVKEAYNSRSSGSTDETTKKIVPTHAAHASYAASSNYGEPKKSLDVGTVAIGLPKEGPATKGFSTASSSGNEANKARQLQQQEQTIRQLADMKEDEMPEARMVIQEDLEEGPKPERHTEEEKEIPRAVEEEETELAKSNRSLFKVAVLGVVLAVGVIVAVVLLVSKDSGNNKSVYGTAERPSDGDSDTNDTSTDPPFEFPTFQNDDVLTFVPEAICMERIPGQGWTLLCTPEMTIEQGGGTCNIVARAFLDQVETADVAIQNSGACRNDIAPGNFTYENSFELLPFTNFLLTLEMPGDQIKLLLEQAMNHVIINESTGGYPYAAGLRYDVNLSAPFLSRISNLEINERFANDEWRLLDVDDTEQRYTVLTNSYLYTNGDSYFAFADTPTEYVDNLGIDATKTFARYAYLQDELLDPPLSEYSTQEFYVNPEYYDIIRQ